ncbi:asparaginase [Reinekea forsetii]|nr:asparaginase [Reinekea forsetii]
MAHYLIINTGGTIGMVDGPKGLTPSAGIIEQTMQTAPELDAWRAHRLSWKQWQPLLDSSDLNPQHWLDIKMSIVDAMSQGNLDGVLVIHGTDTLSYSAAALSYLLTGCKIPVVITGSMLPIGTKNTDALANLALALKGLESKRAEVMVAVGDSLLPAAKATKATTFKHQAFTACQWQDVQWNTPSPKPMTNPFSQLSQWKDVKIGLFTLFPGTTFESLSMMISGDYRAIIINAFGNGNAPSNPTFLELLAQATEKNIPIFIRSQCFEGSVDFELYAAGAMFKEHNAIECGHMSVEAVLTKLQLISAITHSSEELVSLFKTPLSREWQ